MQIRDYRSSDFDSIEAIYNESKMDELLYEKATFTLLPLSQDERRLKALLECTIVVFGEAEIVGYGAYINQEIRALFVKREHRGRGIGDLLLRHMMSKINSNVSLYVARSNWPAIKLYQRHGFHHARDFETDYNGKAVVASEMVCSTPS